MLSTSHCPLLRGPRFSRGVPLRSGQHARGPRSAWRWLGVAFCAGALSACAMGPDFQSPAPQTAQAYSVDAPLAPTTNSDGPAGGAQTFAPGEPIAADWYTLFQSPALNALIDQALANNPSLAASQASLRQAAFQLKSVRGSALPDVDLNGGVTRQRSNGAAIGLDNPQFNNVFNLYSARVALSYDLDPFGVTLRETEAQQARVEYQRNLLRGSILTLVDNVVVTTVRYAALRDQLAATQRIIDAEQDQLDLLGKQESAGSVAYSDVLRARGQLADSQAQVPALRHDLARTEHALARLVGSDPGRFQAPALSLSDLRLPERLPLSLSSELVRQRPDILAAEQQLHAANAQVGVATANLYPRINLSADLGSQANHSGDLFSSPTKVWSLGGSLLAPVFHGGSLRAERDSAKAAWQAQYARYQDTVLSAFTQVADVLDAIEQDAAALSAQNRALDANRDGLTLVRKQYRAGGAAYLDVLIAEQRYNQAVTARIGAVSQRFVDTATLYHALGGGWWNAPAPSQPVAGTGGES
ncbi:efflux transporter outer membrane subunit [Alloalcanivorax mobilis]|uniref:efflux transporter outer membrane subunit n=1 Tax=Alloalcanivorax mobilis TaxID=2019569 RepID=UPI0022B7DFCC|nr:efflux transporter outer membrane subunit [Alloalcanivorax mobilis]